VGVRIATEKNETTCVLSPCNNEKLAKGVLKNPKINKRTPSTIKHPRVILFRLLFVTLYHRDICIIAFLWS